MVHASSWVCMGEQPGLGHGMLVMLQAYFVKRKFKKYKYHVYGKATKQRSRNQDRTQKKIQGLMQSYNLEELNLGSS